MFFTLTEENALNQNNENFEYSDSSDENDVSIKLPVADNELIKNSNCTIKTPEQISESSKKSILPSVTEAFANTNVQFKGAAIMKTRTQYCSEAALTTISSTLTPAGTKPEPAVETLRSYGLPEAGSWHVPLTFVDVYKGREKTREEENRKKAKELSKKNKEINFLKKRGNQSIKDKEKEKRHKGQSSHDSWKSETWMKLRQEFD